MGASAHPAYVIRPSPGSVERPPSAHGMRRMERSRQAVRLVATTSGRTWRAASPTDLRFMTVFATTTPRTGNRAMGVALTVVIVGLALSTGYIHSTLGGLLFTLNAVGYAGLAALYVVGAVAPLPIVQRFSWFPRVALAGYAATTIVAWALQGPYYSTAFIAKGIEVVLITLIAVDVLRVFGSPAAMVRTAFASVFGSPAAQAA